MLKKARILLLSSAYLPLVGGSELAIKNITDRLSDFEFDLVTGRFSNDVPSWEKISNVNVYRVGSPGILAKFILPKALLPLFIFWKAFRLARSNQYSAVHAFQASQAAGGGWLLKFLLPSLPFVVTVQEGKELNKQGFLTRFTRRLIFQKADSVTALSNYLREYVEKIKSDMPISVIPNGVDLENFSRQFSYGELTMLEEKLGIQPDDKVIISVSRLVPKNGLDLLIEAIRVLNTQYPIHNTRYKLILVGTGPLEASLKLKVESLKLEDRVIFAGEVSHEELPLYLKISDVFIRPSRSEGLGNAFLEAMAAGVPIIGTRVGGIPDFLDDRKTGLFSSHAPEDIAFKIRILLENDKLRGEITANAAALVREKYDWEKIAREFRGLYNNF